MKSLIRTGLRLLARKKNYYHEGSGNTDGSETRVDHNPSFEEDVPVSAPLKLSVIAGGSLELDHSAGLSISLAVGKTARSLCHSGHVDLNYKLNHEPYA